MSALSEIGDASIGWLDLLAARPTALEKFNVSTAGWRNAVVFYGVVVLLNIVTNAVTLGSPSGFEVAVGIIAFLLPLASLSAVSVAAARLMGRDAIGLLVTGTYALAFLLLIGLPLTLLLGQALTTPMLGLLGYFLYRSGRGAAGFPVGISIVYALLTLVVLVLVSTGLYIVLTPNGG